MKQFDDFSEDYFGDDSSYAESGDDDPFDSANPFAAPRSGSGHNSGSRRTGSAEEAAARRLAGLGLLIQGWATVSIFLMIVGMIGLLFLVPASGGGPAPRAILGLIGLTGIGMLMAAITILVGEGICLAIPPRSGAKGFIMAAIGLLSTQVIMAVLQALTAPDTGGPFQPMPVGQNLSGVQRILAIAGALAGIGHLICFEMFLNKASLYVRRQDLAKQAMTILIGLPTCLVLILVLSVVAPLLGNYVSPILGLLMLIPVLAASIAMIVLSVMHVALLFKVGSALRA